MGAKVQRLRLRLFIEGVEIPIISAQVQVSPNSPMVASIQIPPLPEATRFLPRSIVHVFFLDFYEIENPNVTVTGDRKKTASTYSREQGQQDIKQQNARDATGNGGDSPEQQDHAISNELVNDARNDKYKLLFAGELMGFSYTKSASNRSVVLQCSDFSNYWDYAFQFNNTDIFGPGLKAMFSGGSTNLFTDLLAGPGEIVTKIIMTPSERYPAMKGLLGGVIHLLESMGGSYYTGKQYAGQNIFFSLAELRLHITQMITAYDKDPTSQRLLGGSYDSLFGRSIGNLGDQASFRKVVNQLISIIFHECYSQPCPMYVPGSEGTVSGYTRKKLAGIEGFAAVASTLDDLRTSLQTLLSDLSAYTNEMAADIFLNAASTTNLLIVRCKDLQKICKTQISKVSSLQVAPEVTSVKTKLNAILTTTNASIGAAIALLKKGFNSYDAASEKITDAQTQIIKALAIEANVTPSKEAIPAQLKQQIFRPDVWFSAPPRCNVFFPDQYSSLSYNRQFMAEPTRLLLKTNDEFFGEDELFDHFYFAPKAVTLKEQKNSLQSILKGDILDHELFTGILPVFEKMGEFNIFAARSGMVDGKTPKLGLAQRSTNFLYFKYRFAARQMQVTGRFNPYIACGFPGLVIDKYVDVQTLKLHQELIAGLPGADAFPTREINKMLGTHFLANFTEVTHSIDQGQGTTLVNCGYARQPEESVEFLGAKQDETVMQQQSGTSKRTETWAYISPPRVGSQGPLAGRITQVMDVSGKFKSSSFIDAQKVALGAGAKDKKTGQTSTKVQIGFNALAQAYGPEVVALVGDEKLPIVFYAFEVTEEIGRSKKTTVELPPEEYIRPGWYGDCWHPAKISDVYYEFFGTGSITEPTSTQNTGPDDGSGLASSDAGQTLTDMINSDNPLAAARDKLIQLSLTKDSNIEQAVAYLVLTYSVIKQGGFDPEQFIRSYTWRPIATMVDMFGTSDLLLDEQGKAVVSGSEGFHSRAFGPYDDLFGLVTSDIEKIVGIAKGSPTSKKADTRKRKYEKVLDYVSSLRLSRAQLG